MSMYMYIYIYIYMCVCRHIYLSIHLSICVLPRGRRMAARGHAAIKRLGRGGVPRAGRGGVPLYTSMFYIIICADNIVNMLYPFIAIVF